MWNCTKCGAEIPDEYEVCFKCGNIRLAAVPESTAKSGKAAKGKGLIAVVAAVLVVAVLLSVSMLFHFRAAKQLDRGNYHQAIELAEKDFLFGSGIERDARKALGDKYMSSGDYEKAAEQFELMGRAGHEDWSEAVYALGEQLLEEGEYDEAIEAFGRIADEERGRVGQNTARIHAAMACIHAGEYDKGLEYADAVDAEYAEEMGVEDVREEALFCQGTDCLEALDFSGAESFYEQCAGRGATAYTLEAVRLVQQGKCYEAAKYIDPYTGSMVGVGEVPQMTWVTVFAELAYRSKDIGSKFDSMAAFNFLDGRELFFAPEDAAELQRYFPEDRCPSGIAAAMEEIAAEQVSSAILTECGKAPDGRVLVLYEVNNFVEQSREYAIAWELMGYLPEACIPYSPDSVEYIVRISYDRQGDGWYNVPDMGSVNAFQEYVKIYTDRANPREILEVSQTVWGEEAPDTIYISDIVDNYISGGAPAPEAVAEAFCQAMREVLER